MASDVALLTSFERTPAASEPSAIQQMYVDACSAGAGGGVALDTYRFARALADASVGALAEQRLYQLAVVAAADGEPALATEDILAALAVG